MKLIVLKIIRALSMTTLLAHIVMFSCIFLCRVFDGEYKNLVNFLVNTGCELRGSMDIIEILFFCLFLMFLSLIVNAFQKKIEFKLPIKKTLKKIFDFSEEAIEPKILLESAYFLVYVLTFVQFSYNFNHCGNPPLPNW
jgi:phosphate starvation-inducible membrane PsiE